MNALYAPTASKVCGHEVPYQFSLNACRECWIASLEPEQRAAVLFLDSKIADEAKTKAPTPGGEPDPARSKRQAEAIAFIASYTGRFGLIIDLRADRRFGSKWFRLSDRQIEVVLASKAREEQWAADRAAGEAAVAEGAKFTPAPTVIKLPMGRRYYAVDAEGGQTTFLRITRTERDFTYIDQEIGGRDLPQMRGTVLPNGQYVGTFQSLYQKVVDDPETAMKRYGLEIGRCGYCARTLTDETSRKIGIGPVCRTKGFGGAE